MSDHDSYSDYGKGIAHAFLRVLVVVRYDGLGAGSDFELSQADLVPMRAGPLMRFPSIPTTALGKNQESSSGLVFVQSVQQETWLLRNAFATFGNDVSAPLQIFPEGELR